MTDSKPSNNCPDCGSEIPAESPDAICPACLMKQAFATRTANQGKKTLSPPPSPEEIADKFPQFEITECLGQGGMGVVYKARQKSLNRWVAIKTLAPERLENDHFAERFSREAQTLALLSHPNIVTVHDYGETDGLFYIVMEYVDGVNLRDLLHDGKMDSAQALSIVPPICEALQYAHDKGIVHRDIKPENLLIDREGRVKIADFGIASLVGDTNEKSGTPPYMAPEQGSHEDVDHRADIYALGVVLYEMLTGERPATPLNLPSQKVQLDIRIDDIVLRAINKEPERRYRTAEEFRTVVENISVQTHSNTPPPITASAPVIPPMPTKQRGMFRRWWWILLISILLGPVIGFFGNIFLRDLSPKKFEASAIVEVRPKNISESLSNFPQELFEELLTQENLEQLVDRHELKKRWKLSNKDTISKLRKSIQIQQVRGTDLIEVRVAAENANLAPLIANSFVEIAGKKQTSAQFIVHDKATRSAQPTALWIQGTRGILISVALGLLIVPLLALAVMAMLHRMIPDRSSAIHHPELSGEQKARRTFYGKVSLWLFLTAILGTLAMMTLSHRDEMALTFGVFALLLSIIFWVMSRYRR
ncbi:MAG: serine/threonine protein kinase, partial [Luteolibacter sp.]